MIQNIGSLAPDAGGGKARGLDLLARNGIPVPLGFILAKRDELPDLTKGLYAVRSSAETEDGTQASHAGQFLSRVRVQAKDVPMAVSEVITFAEKIHGEQNFFVIVQTWIESTVSGVAFSRHPTKDMPDVLVIDAVQGSNERLMSGEVGAQRAFVWNDAMLAPDAFPIPRAVAKELQTLIQRIEKLIHHPADVEWAWDGHNLWILQARPITRTPTADALDREEARVMHLFAAEPELVLDRNDFAESAPRPDEATFRKIQNLYHDHGPFHQAAKELGLDFRTEDAQQYLRLIFGWLYADATHQPVKTAGGFFAGIRSVFRLSAELTRFAKNFYQGNFLNEDPKKIYAKASILSQFAMNQKVRPVPAHLWELRSASTVKRASWKEPKTLEALYAIIREDAKVATYNETNEEVIPLPIILTRKEALDLRNSVQDASGDVKGEGVSTGKATAEAFIASEAIPMTSEVIVVLKTLSPDWFPFLNENVKGIITETGSSMSHGAIQCRERGIPAIFGAMNATRRIPHGKKISMDGKRGVIK